MLSTDSGGSPQPFDVLPAIDLRSGRVVRLTEGDFERATTYDDDPLATAERFVEAGARWIHVVDLDGAQAGRARQRELIRDIVTLVGDRAACQVAGGLRDAAAVATALEDGAARVVVGTAALSDPAFAAGLVRRHGPGRIVAALDVRDGSAVGEGWHQAARGVPVEIALAALADAGVIRFAVTAIERDGALRGPDLELVRRLVALGRGAIVASAGMRSIDDLVATRAAGATGAIVGKAIYEGRLDLAAAVDRLAALE